MSAKCLCSTSAESELLSCFSQRRACRVCSDYHRSPKSDYLAASLCSGMANFVCYLSPQASLYPNLTQYSTMNRTRYAIVNRVASYWPSQLVLADVRISFQTWTGTDGDCEVANMTIEEKV